MNEDLFLLYADTREIKTDSVAENVVGALQNQFSYTPERRSAVLAQLQKRTDPYEPIEQKLSQTTVDAVKKLNLAGIHFLRQPHRAYPEHNLAAQVVGFLGKDNAGNDLGRYGIEGYWQKTLAGTGGFFSTIKSASGNWLKTATGELKLAEDGADLVLTIDRTLQYRACERLRQGMTEYGAASASLVIMEPKTGAVLAMCSLPDFDPNEYGKVDSVAAYNNSTIFTAYEPGSIFKPLIMSAALNENVVTPTTPFHDTGRVDGICQHPIQNAGNKAHGDQDMTGILQNSINTGMVYVAQHLGKSKEVNYIKRFGFGVETGIELDTESSGNINSLTQNKSTKFDCYTATAAFGQGITATPLQAATAFSAIANGGTLMKPFIIKEKRFADGHTEVTKPKPLYSILSRRASTQLSSMLVTTVDTGYSGRARVPGYRVAGKSGTAEIPGPGGYTKTYNHSFIGYAPAEDPRYVMIVKFEKPTAAYAESTAAPVFGELSKFILEYFQVPPTR
jgi:cell division protein FtsI/penicillin-binding protein 2